jgi:hypothetical protein
VKLSSGITIPCITGQVGQVDEVSQNGYRYKSDFWDKVLGDPIIQEIIKAHDMLGTIEHPTDDEKFLKTPYDEASHIVLKAWVQDHNPFATFGLLNNDKGNQIKALIDVGHRPGVSTRGLGQFDRDAISQFVSDQDYVLITWDIVRSPNFSTLKMNELTDAITDSAIFKELMGMHQIKDSAYKGYDKNLLIADMGKAIAELQQKYEFLKNSL